MQGFLDSIGVFIQAHQAWAGPLIALVAFTECLAIVGILIVAPPVMAAIGALIGSGLIDPASSVASAIIGAAAGFFVSYLIGRWVGPGVVHRWPLKNYRHAVARARLLFRRYATASIFFCRFFGPLRVTVPLIGGMTGMSHHRFQLANIASAIVWAPLFLAPGWLAARGMQSLSDLVGGNWLAIAAAVLVVGGVAAVVLLKMKRQGSARRRRMAERAQRRMQARATAAMVS